jgi:hypothetical protein
LFVSVPSSHTSAITLYKPRHNAPPLTPFFLLISFSIKASRVTRNYTCLTKLLHLCLKYLPTMTKNNAVVPIGKPVPVSQHFSCPPPCVSNITYPNYKKLLNQIDLGGGHKINSWLDCMRSSSPTQTRKNSMLSSSLVMPLEDETDKWIVSFCKSIEKFVVICLNSVLNIQIFLFRRSTHQLCPNLRR